MKSESVRHRLNVRATPFHLKKFVAYRSEREHVYVSYGFMTQDGLEVPFHETENQSVYQIRVYDRNGVSSPGVKSGPYVTFSSTAFQALSNEHFVLDLLREISKTKPPLEELEGLIEESLEGMED
ncbi:MAG: hypothetical protein WC796_03835 [Candidatus Pacearchaeota archaeon]|jgi:hypothetical protein